MATVETREQKRNGKIYKSKRWYVRYTDMQGKRRRVSAFNDKRTSERLGHQIEELIACRSTGSSPPAQLAKAIEKLPETDKNRILSAFLTAKI